VAVQLSTGVRNARLDQLETTIGTAPLFRLYSGAMPADCATAASGTKLVETALPSDWMANAASGAKAKSGTWSSAAVASGTAGYFRLYDAAGTTCHVQGTVTATGGGGDLTLDNTSIASSQTVTINTFTLTDGNA
jgi:hypothetical protein